MIYAGIDPGATGALALIHSDGFAEVVRATKDPTETLTAYLHKMARENDLMHEAVYVALEQQQSIREQGVKSTFTTGRRFGQLEGMLVSCGVPHILVRPKEWQKTFGLTKKYSSKAERKAAHIETARRLFPSIEIKKSYDGVADALLLAEHARRLHG